MQTVAQFCPSVNESKSTGKDKAKALRERIDVMVDGLAKAVDDVRASDTFKSYLDVQARFHRYSWHNSMLILWQRPDASRVAGFQTWKKLGRHVRQGERGIMIFAPCPFHKERERNDGTTESVDGVFFKPVHVFDVSQTDGKALPDVDVPIIDADAEALLTALERVVAKRGFRLEYQTLDGSANGFTDKSGRIVIRSDNPIGHKAHTLAHELAHQALHFDKANRPDKLTRDVAELEAESVAYVVCKHFGIDADVTASRYIALWSGDGKAMRESLQRIAETARTIIDEAESVQADKAVA